MFCVIHSAPQVELEGASGGRSAQAEGSELASAQDLDTSAEFCPCSKTFLFLCALACYIKTSPVLVVCLQFSIDFRVLLTGTPVQNNLTELYSLLSFIQPRVFAADGTDDFVESYANIRSQPALGKMIRLQPL